MVGESGDKVSYQIDSAFSHEAVEAEGIDWETWIDPESWGDKERAFFWRLTCEQESQQSVKVRARLSALLGVPACWNELMPKLEAELSKLKAPAGTGILLHVKSDGTPNNTEIYDLRTGAGLASRSVCIEFCMAEPTDPVKVHLGFGNGLLTVFASFDVVGQDSEGKKYRLTGQGDVVSARLRDEAGSDVEFASITWRLNVGDAMAEMEIAEIDSE